MAVGGAQVAVAIKAQSALGTAAIGTHDIIKHDSFTPTEGRITDQGRPEVGGALQTGNSIDVYGAQPGAQGNGKFRVEYGASLLPLAGLQAGTPTTGITPYTPAATAAAWLYHTLVYKWETGSQFAIRDCRASRLVIDHSPFQAPTFDYALLGCNLIESAVTLAQFATAKVPSPAATIAGANLTFAGTASTTMYGFRFQVESVIDNTQQPLGALVPEDVVPASLIVSASSLVQMSVSNYKKYVLGDAAAVAITASLPTGAMNVRINSPDATPGYIEYVFADAKYLVSAQDALSVTPQGQVLLRVTAVPTGAVTVNVKP